MFLLDFPLYKIKIKSKRRVQKKPFLTGDGFSKTRKHTYFLILLKSESHRPARGSGEGQHFNISDSRVPISKAITPSLNLIGILNIVIPQLSKLFLPWSLKEKPSSNLSYVIIYILMVDTPTEKSPLQYKTLNSSP